MAGAQGSLPFLYQDFSGGLNTRDQAFLLSDNQARDLNNVQGTQAGAIIKRNGLVTFASPANTLTSLFPLEALSPVKLIAAGATFLYSISTGGTVTQIQSGLTNNARWEFISGPANTQSGTQGPLYGMNGVDTPQQWNGVAASTSNWTALDTGGSVPNGKYCLYANNQVFVSGVAAQPSRVYWSGIADPCAWNPANLNGSGFMDFDPNDGQVISGLGRVGPYILVAKPRKLWILVDPASATARRLSDNVGCIAHRSIVSGTEGTYFLAEDRGVYLTNGSKLEPISDLIQPTIDSIQAGLRSQCSATYLNGHYYLSVPLNTSNNDTVLDFDAVLKSWWKHTFGSNQFAIWHPSGTAQLYSAKGTSAIVDQCFVANTTVDNGTAFTWSWYGPWQSPTFYRRRRFPTPYFRKRMRQVRFMGSGTVDYYLAKDFAGAPSLIQANIFAGASSNTFGGTDTFGVSGVWGDTGSVSKAKVFGGGVANAFSVVLQGTSTTADSVNLYTFMLTDRRDLIPS